MRIKRKETKNLLDYKSRRLGFLDLHKGWLVLSIWYVGFLVGLLPCYLCFSGSLFFSLLCFLLCLLELSFQLIQVLVLN